jgi:hypothetical protein
MVSDRRCQANNVVHLRDWRVPVVALSNCIFPNRLTLGRLCKYNSLVDGPITVTVAGTWTYTGFNGMPGSVETRRARVNQDPQFDRSAQGYLMRPSGDSGFIFALFGDVASGDLQPIF